MYTYNELNQGNFPIMQQCQTCNSVLCGMETAKCCGNPACKDSSMVILHFEEDADMAEWLAMNEFTAGD